MRPRKAAAWCPAASGYASLHGTSLPPCPSKEKSSEIGHPMLRRPHKAGGIVSQSDHGVISPVDRAEEHCDYAFRPLVGLWQLLSSAGPGPISIVMVRTLASYLGRRPCSANPNSRTCPNTHQGLGGTWAYSADLAPIDLLDVSRGTSDDGPHHRPRTAATLTLLDLDLLWPAGWPMIEPIEGAMLRRIRKDASPG